MYRKLKVLTSDKIIQVEQVLRISKEVGPVYNAYIRILWHLWHKQYIYIYMYGIHMYLMVYIYIHIWYTYVSYDTHIYGMHIYIYIMVYICI